MNKNEYKIEVDHLAIGLTKSPQFMGVNIRLFFANLVLCALICIDVHTFWGVPLFLMLHLCMVKASFNEPNFLFIWAKSFMNTPPVLNYRYWGKTNSYEV
jgi:type IV secretory pathway VirB3-like protein